MLFNFFTNLLIKRPKKREPIKVPGGYIDRPEKKGKHPRKCTCRKCISNRSKKIK